MHMFLSALPFWFLVCAFNPFIFKVIIDKYVTITIKLIVLVYFV